MDFITHDIPLDVLKLFPDREGTRMQAEWLYAKKYFGDHGAHVVYWGRDLGVIVRDGARVCRTEIRRDHVDGFDTKIRCRLPVLIPGHGFSSDDPEDALRELRDAAPGTGVAAHIQEILD